MNKIDYNMLSGTDLELRRQEVLSSNLAAASIPGYKGEFLISKPFSGDSSRDGSLDGVSGGTLKIDYAQGEIKRTERRLDFAIQGEGFFMVRSSDNKDMYTRNGTFSVDRDMRLVTGDGFAVLDDSGNEIRFAPEDNLNDLEVMPDGTLRVMGSAQQNYAYKTYGKLNVTQISNKEELERLTGNYYRMLGDAAPKPFAKPENFAVINSALESSNISPIKTMTMLIQSSREFEMGTRIMRMMVEMNSRELQTFAQ